MILTILQRTLQFLANRVEAERRRLGRKEHKLVCHRSRVLADFEKRHAAMIRDHQLTLASIDAEQDSLVEQQELAIKLKRRIAL